MTSPTEELAWMQQGKCVDRPPDAMFPKAAGDQHAAAAECRAGCLVIRRCLAYALDTRTEFGVWGGMTERERRALLKKHPSIDSWADVLR